MLGMPETWDGATGMIAQAVTGTLALRGQRLGQNISESPTSGANGVEPVDVGGAGVENHVESVLAIYDALEESIRERI
jgi:hypothetical protein